MGVRRKSAVLAVATAAVMAVAGCGSSSADSSSGSGGGSGKQLNVVASTNVWGNIAEQVGGKRIKVTSLISDPDQDPHSFEANTKNQLQISKADLVIANGGGYDDFVNRMVKASKSGQPTVLDAVKISGKKAPKGEELNEHVWYDFPTVGKVVDQVTSTLSQKLPAGAKTFKANAGKFKAKISSLESQERSIKSKAKGKGAAITEPVPLYMLEACGLVNKTPDDFSEAIEEGTDVPTRVLQQTLKLFKNHSVKVLAYNAQTSGPPTQQVKKAAKANHVPVVPVTETLPKGKTYVSWMTGNLDGIKHAVGA